MSIVEKERKVEVDRMGSGKAEDVVYLSVMKL